MRKHKVVAFATASLVGAALLPLSAGSSGAAPASTSAAAEGIRDADHRSHVLNQPAWAKKEEAINRAALEKRLRTGGTGAAEKVAKGQYGRVETAGKEKIFVVLAEFGDVTHPAVPDDPEQSDATTFDGPMHNQIPKPNRKKDNSTLWQENYGRKHYENMYFTRMRNFYERESSGKFTFGGDVTEWVKVPFNQARYGRNENNTMFLVRDALAYWVDMKLEAGWSMDRVTRYLKSFDSVDRYDFDEDGDFNEPDGFIDHFQLVHAGGDESDGDPVYGVDAIWAHKGHAQVQPPGTGPEGGAQIGGVNAGEGGASGGGIVNVPDNPTGVWVNDYTVQTENGCLSVFAHEFAHDLGLPDLYDTSGNDGGAENSVGFWSLMAQSRGTFPGDVGIGDRPMPMGAWDKFMLGWLDYDLAKAGWKSTHKIRPNQSSDASSTDDGLVVLLPNKKVTQQVGEPCAECGERYFYSDQGNDLDNDMVLPVSGGGALTAKVNYEIEQDWDYAFLEASTDNGENWTSLPTNLSDTIEDHENPAEHNQSGLNPDDTGMTGFTDGWVDLTAEVPAEATHIRFHYVTDGAAVESGFRVDNITLAGEVVGDAETDDEGWVFDGFRITTGSDVNEFTNAYFVDNRQWVGGDKTLTHLYNFAGLEKKPNWVDFFNYSPGALITYWDSSYFDNNVGDHPGHGELLPVDAHPEFDHAPDGSLLRPRIATHDSAFGLTRTKKVTLRHNGEEITLARKPGQPLFDDMQDWWFPTDEHSTDEGHPGHYQPGWYSADVPKTGTTIRVVRVNKAGVMTVRVGTSG